MQKAYLSKIALLRVHDLWPVPRDWIDIKIQLQAVLD